MQISTDPFKVLPGPPKALICQMSSSDFRALHLVSRIWRDQVRESIAHLKPAGLIDHQCNVIFPHLQHLELTADFINIQPLKGLLKALSSLSKLESIAFEYDGRVDEEELSSLFSYSPFMRWSIGFKIGGDEKLILLKLIKKLISIRCPPEISDEGLALLANYEDLEKISARGQRDLINGCGLRALAALPKLREIDLAFSHVKGDSLIYLKDLMHITRIDLAFCENLRRGELAALGSVKTLVDLDVSATAITDGDVVAWHPLLNLARLGLQLCCNITPMVVMSIKRFENLKELKAGQNDHIFKAVWENLKKELDDRRYFRLKIEY